MQRSALPLVRGVYDRAYEFAGELSLGALLAGTVGLSTNLVAVRGYEKGCSDENVEFFGTAA